MSRIKKDDAVFKARAHPVRRKILDLLKDSEMTTGDLAARFDTLDRTTVMQHLGVLERADLIIVKRDGRERWNYLNPLPIKEIYDRWISKHAIHALDFAAKLKRDLEQ
jgi:DNA-binding transcriptional ArsR family regulator